MKASFSACFLGTELTAAGGLEHQCLLMNPVFKQSFRNRQKEIKKPTDKQKKTENQERYTCK